MVPKESRKKILDMLVENGGRSQLEIRLCKNNPAPADADVVIGDLTECDFDGYALQQPAWGAAAIDGASVASVETGVLEFTAGAGLAAPQTVYGVYATAIRTTQDNVRRLVWWDRLDATVTLSNPGEMFRRVCKMQDTNYAP